MKIELWAIGKTNEAYLETGIDIYLKRLKHYLKLEWRTFPDLKNAASFSADQIKQKEGQLALDQIKSGDFLILLDEKGKSLSSVGFATFLEQQLQMSHKRILFMIGGAYGFSAEVYERANYKLSLSEMTFSHQMVRLFLVEQLYRAMTLLNNEPYHNP
ncbi:MAG TPA: 23S rRNA (pseudouridine(1915)-N(3))-methyltransferase RlmH [Saprospiraceae bacterium]|nr:23S rRNA (pseudouridine(1915)-N(3))-methyltransferase RlmH [Saprospiraceae bacterium]HMQ81400.1 23S rRNA (pseudouridine(1915)-N(3))-methyltransferase RlmH [Saprospiraceae bacterium]